MSIFRAYDIRGIYPSELNEDIAYKIGLAYSNFLKPKKVVIGRDLRKQSEKIHDSFIQALRDSGVDVTTIGPCTTPMLTFAAFNYSFDGAVMVTPSHLPKQFAGLKLYREKAISLSGPKGINQLERLVKKGKFSLDEKDGKLTKLSIQKDYKNFMLAFSEKTKLNIVVDCGNGMGYLTIPILKKLANVTTLYEKPNMSFPNHVPDPNKKENRRRIEKMMKSGKYDIGIVFDGDCDRVGFIDEKGDFIPMDHSTGMLSMYFLEKARKTKNVKIVYEIRTSHSVPEAIKEFGGNSVMSKAGHSFIHQVMLKNNATFGGEKSGHYFFKAFNSNCNALLAAIFMIDILTESILPCSELAKPFNKYVQIEETNFKVKDQDKVMAKVEQYFKKKAKSIKKIDGISVYLKHGWFNLRKSNTESVLRLNAESNTKRELKEIVSQAKTVIRKYK